MPPSGEPWQRLILTRPSATAVFAQRANTERCRLSSEPRAMGEDHAQIVGGHCPGKDSAGFTLYSTDSRAAWTPSLFPWEGWGFAVDFSKKTEKRD
jgi:hypothetical protein